MTATGRARELAEEVVTAHGGLAQWRQSAAFDVRFSARGLAFLSKGQSTTLSNVCGRFGTASQSASLIGRLPHPWNYEARGSAALLDDLRPLVRGRLRWTIQDVATFAATAMWTYLNLPFLLLDPGIQLDAPAADGQRFRRLDVQFPPAIATHSSRQTLHIDSSGLIRKHDYTARAIGRWASGRQTLSRYREFDGIWFATRRRVTPRLGRLALPLPSLVEIEVQDLRRAEEAR